MNAQKLKTKRTERRQHRVRRSIYGTPERPRLSVFRSNLHIYAQLIDDLNGVTIAAASSNDKGTTLKHGANIASATEIGKKLAAAATAKGIKQAAFDRGPFRFHGRIAALARAATEGGLVCTGLEAPKPKEAAPAPVVKAKADAKPKSDKPKGERPPAKPKK